MFLKNWYVPLASCFLYGINNTDKMTYKGYTGNEYPASWGTGYLRIGETSGGSGYLNMRNCITNLDSGNAGVVFGTGTTPPTLDDYCLSGDLVSNYVASVSISSTPDEDGVSLTALYTITNNGDSAFTIAEIGLVCNIHSSYGSYANAMYKALLERTVLTEPVTIQAGGVGLVRYNIRVNLPTA
jgi:hypothetical protein